MAPTPDEACRSPEHPDATPAAPIATMIRSPAIAAADELSDDDVVAT
jgi:hypothetical protein